MRTSKTSWMHYGKQRELRLWQRALVSTSIALLLILAGGWQSGCARTIKPVLLTFPISPCPEIVDLLKNPMERRNIDIMDMADREVCLIGWLEKVRAVKVWK